MVQRSQGPGQCHGQNKILSWSSVHVDTLSSAFRAEARPLKPGPEDVLSFPERNSFNVDIAIEKLLAFLDTPSGKETNGRCIVMPALDVRIAAVIEERHQRRDGINPASPILRSSRKPLFVVGKASPDGMNHPGIEVHIGEHIDAQLLKNLNWTYYRFSQGEDI